MTTPKRVQRKRERGWRKGDNCVIVDRTSRWGNPFRVGDPVPSDSLFLNASVDGVPLARRGSVEDGQHAVDLFAFWLMAKVPYSQADIRRELAGKDLACFCPLPEPGEPDHCHAALLLSLANGDPDV
jgi:hypothetical protein